RRRGGRARRLPPGQPGRIHQDQRLRPGPPGPGRLVRRQPATAGRLMPRPIMLSIVGDSGSGKTTITRGVVRVLGDDKVTHFSADDYHRYDRRQRAERGITPLDPECNYIDVLTCDIRHMRHNEAILKPVYQHAGGTFGPPVYLKPARFVVAEGLL